MLMTTVFRKAGCGKSARPVWRGGGRPLVPSLLYCPSVVSARGGSASGGKL